MLSRMIGILGLAAAALAPLSAAQAERRVALVVGNAAYAHAPVLRNPQNDANDVADQLQQLGFEVVLGVDLDQPAFARHIDRFARLLDGADVALFYYAGHGVQINDKNYLVATNAQLASEFMIPAETIEVDALVRLMESKTAVNLVFLDACRNNPLAEELRRNLAALKRSAVLGRGLARVEPAGRDTLIAFAAAPGQEAADGNERNSPFTGALLRHIAKPAQEVSVMLKEVAADVRRDTRNAQRPQQLSDMTRTFYFAKGEQVAVAETVGRPEPPRREQAARPASPPAAPADDRALDMAFWNAAQAANDCEAMRAYLNRFPNGIFVELARITERRLCTPTQSAAAASAPAAQPPAPAPMVAPASPAAEPAPSLTTQPAQPAPLAQPVPASPPAIRAELQSAEPTPSAPSGAPQRMGAVESDPARKASSAPETPTAAPSLPAATSPPLPPADPRVTAAPAVAPVPPPAQPSSADLRRAYAELARGIQRELARVGCTIGDLTEVWDLDSQEAVERFNEHGRWRFDPRTPTPALLAALQRSEGRVCPLECESGYEPRGSTCVAVTPPQPAPRQAARPPEKKQPERRPAAAKPTPARQAKPREATPPRREVRTPPRERRAEQEPRRAGRPVAGEPVGRGGLRCRFVPRSTGGGYNGDTVEVCN